MRTFEVTVDSDEARHAVIILTAVDEDAAHTAACTRVIETLGWDADATFFDTTIVAL